MPVTAEADGLTTSADSLLVRNWQDILAIYVYEQSQKGTKEFTLDSSSKDELAEIFAKMNPVVRDKENITHVSYGNYHINTYIKQNNIAQDKRSCPQEIHGDRLQASLRDRYRCQGICTSECWR